MWMLTSAIYWVLPMGLALFTTLHTLSLFTQYMFIDCMLYINTVKLWRWVPTPWWGKLSGFPSFWCIFEDERLAGIWKRRETKFSNTFNYNCKLVKERFCGKWGKRERGEIRRLPRGNSLSTETWKIRKNQADSNGVLGLENDIWRFRLEGAYVPATNVRTHYVLSPLFSP